MKFHIAAVEPKGFAYGHFLDELCKTLCFGLESLGHDCSIGFNRLDGTRTNIVVGAHLFTSPQDVETIAQQGPYIAIQSEIVRPEGVNLYRDQQQYEMVYLPFLRRAMAVWEGVPTNVAVLERLDIRAQLLLGGYHPAMEEVVHKQTKDIDFLFYGSVTPHRRSLLQALQQRGYRLEVVFDVRAMFRNDLIARTKVNLAPAQGQGMDHLAWGRICFLLNNRSLVVVEQSDNQQWLEHCFPSAETHRWVDLCEETLNAPDRIEKTVMYYERFRAMPYTEQLERVLDESLGAESGERGTGDSSLTS
ncbi:MAG: hypothetical protein ACC645_00280 [Pirellulales bacterium]